jgi:PIN domain nuclease of toxin-antitoxin system
VGTATTTRLVAVSMWEQTAAVSCRKLTLSRSEKLIILQAQQREHNNYDNTAVYALTARL